MKYVSTKIIDLGSCAFRQWKAQSHCKFIHGYRLQAKFWFGCSTLDDKNWVVDFGGLKGLKDILEKQFDHTLCISDDDPLLEGFKALHAAGGCDLRIMPGGVGIEKTAEWCFKAAQQHCHILTNGRCWVEKVEVWEHEKNSAIITEHVANNFIPQVFNTSHVTTGNSDTVATTIQPQINQVHNFLNEVQQETGVNVANVIKHPPVIQPSRPAIAPIPAPVGNKTSSGYGNLFGGTSWGV